MEKIPEESTIVPQNLDPNFEEQKQKKQKKGYVDWLWLVLLAFLIRSCAFEPYNIPSSSMVPTLLIGDYLFTSKFDYGYSRHSFPFSLPIIPKGRIFNNPPNRGDIVIFKLPKDKSTDYIKRVIGVPGDIIRMFQGRLYINNQIVPREFLKEEDWLTEAGIIRYSRYRETLPNGKQHEIYEINDSQLYDNTESVTVPEGYYFMMGDNRDNSLDSRDFGLVHEDLLEAKARFIFYSTNGDGYFFQFWRWTSFLRLDRFFMDLTK